MFQSFGISRVVVWLSIGLLACSSGSDFSGGATKSSPRATPHPHADAVKDEPLPTDPPLTVDSATQQPSIVSDESSQEIVTCKATIGSTTMAGDKAKLSITTTGKLTTIYVNDKQYPLDSSGGLSIDEVATSTDQTFKVSTDGTTMLCSAKMVAGLTNCPLQLDITPVSGTADNCKPCGGQNGCDWTTRSGTTTFTLPAGAKNFKVAVTSLYFDDRSGVLQINGHTAADYSGESGEMGAHTLSVNADISSMLVAGQNTAAGSVFNIQCPGYGLTAHLSGTFQAPACN